MKKYLFVLSLLISVLACKKGDTGPAGENGNANATQYSFGSQNLVSTFSQLQITTTLDTMNNSTWLVYLYYEPLKRWYFLPGLGVGGQTNYRVSMDYVSPKVNIYIDKTGPGEVYAQAKVVRIYNNNSQPGGRAHIPLRSAVDYSDYQAVRQYYNLP